MSATLRTIENIPTIIEAAITPYRPGEPLQDSDAMVDNAIECFAAGAGIVHHHHDFRQERTAAIAQMIDVESRILAEVPTALMYGDYLKAKAVTDKMAHLQPMADAGVLRMLAIDPGHTMFCGNDSLGRPIRAGVGGTTYGEAHELIDFAKAVDVPISLGVYEPGQLRWIMAYERAVGYPAGSIIKIYFGGDYLIDKVASKGLNVGMPPTLGALDVYVSMLEGSNLPWVISLLGGTILDSPLARRALELGGNLRVGIEDTAGTTDMTNAETVTAAIALASHVGRPIATTQTALAALHGAA
jgi:3-keto-5-aminohexanoate cleavage enzyme